MLEQECETWTDDKMKVHQHAGECILQGFHRPVKIAINLPRSPFHADLVALQSTFQLMYMKLNQH